MEKKLYRSKTDKKLCGVCGGMAKYFNMDPTLVRILWVIVTLCAFIGLIAYIICALVIPEEPTGAEAPIAEVKPAEEKKEEAENKSEENVENK